MDIIEMIKEKAEKFAVVTAQKSGELIDNGKLRFAIAEAKVQISNRYKEIGELAYNARKNEYDASEALEQKFEEIDKCFELIQTSQEKLDELKNLKTCPDCNSKVSKNFAFCPKCGRKID